MRRTRRPPRRIRSSTTSPKAARASMRKSVWSLGAAPRHTEEGRSFLQQRIALFGGTLTLLSLFFYAASFVVTLAALGTPGLVPFVTSRSRVHELLLGAVALFVWLVARRRPLTEE